MKRIRSKRVESIFHEALALPEYERAGYLEEVCSGDPSLHKMVSSLLENFKMGGDLDIAAVPSLYDESELDVPALREGEHLAHYEIIRFLGKGAMGEVYLARHPRLGNKVAIKILPKNLTASWDIIDRFMREAQAASALNHPNILTIHDCDPQSGTPYIVSEFVEGSSLREHIGKLSIESILAYATQIGRALQVAHTAGIVHRDIKPENIMVRPDGYIKILDFGLAKLVGVAVHTHETDRLLPGDTMPGVLLGTPSYMSPEQIRCQPLDQRTDIWSWGVVLYEMLAARRPFEEDTRSDVMAAILNKEPEPPTQSEELNRIIRRALSKDIDERYQDMSDALENLAQVRVPKQPIPHPRPVYHARRRTIRRIGMLVLAAVLLAAVVYVLKHPPSPVALTNIVPITTSGNVTHFAISPDGNYICYSVQEGMGQSIRLRHLATNAEIEMTSVRQGEYSGITFSRDSQMIYFVVTAHALGTLYRMPLLAPSVLKVVVDDVDSPVSFSPDGSRFVFLRNSSKDQKISLIIRGLSTGAENKLATLDHPDNFWPGPIWSPDGRFVLCGFVDPSPGIKLMAVEVETGTKSVIGPERWYWMGKPAWLWNERSFAVAANIIDSNRTQVLQMRWLKGDALPITHDMADYRDLDSSINTHKLLALQSDRISNLWIIPLNSHELPKVITQTGRRFYGITWSKLNKLFSQTDIGGHPGLWSLNLGSQKKELMALTDDQYVKQAPVASPDGTYLIYSSNRDGAFHLWRSDEDGGHPVPLTSGTSQEEAAAITPDGKWLVYTSKAGGFQTLWRMPAQGGAPVQFWGERARKPSISPDGNLIAFETSADLAQGWHTVVRRFPSGEKIGDFADISAEGPVIWSADGKELLYISTHDEVSNIWAQPIDGGRPQQMTPFIEELIFACAPSPDRNSLACIRGSKTSDVVWLQTEQ